MQAFDDEAIAARLRALLGARGISIAEMASMVGVAYRTLQNQLLGKSKMPASTFLRILTELKIPASYVALGRFDLGKEALAQSLEMSLGAALPVMKADDKGGITVTAPPPNDGRTQEQRLEHAGWLAFAVELNYQASARHPGDPED